MTTRHLDLGCGSTPRNPYRQNEVHAIDLVLPDGVDPACFRSANLSCQAIPYPDSSFDSVSAYDFLEHVPRILPTAEGTGTVFPFIRLMNEIWRVLVPGGRFFALTPCFPSLQAFTDPTHVNFITEHTHTYFCGDSPASRMYGFNGHFTAQRVRWAMLPEDYFPAASLSWSRTVKRLIRLKRGRLSHIVWELEAVKPLND